MKGMESLLEFCIEKSLMSGINIVFIYYFIQHHQNNNTNTSKIINDIRRKSYKRFENTENVNRFTNAFKFKMKNVEKFDL
jgi:hypothetical protein